jgi:hypothetical protein
MRFIPLAASSSAACAAIQAKMPVVMGQAMSTLCFFARVARISLMVMSFPRGTFFMIASTSTGAGITIVPSPQRRVILPSTRPIFGRPLLSASLSRQDFFLTMADRIVPETDRLAPANQPR